jgi:hypothetical protein
VQLADVKKGITDDDIIALASDEANQPAVVWDLADLQVNMHSCATPSLTLETSEASHT